MGNNIFHCDDISAHLPDYLHAQCYLPSAEDVAKNPLFVRDLKRGVPPTYEVVVSTVGPVLRTTNKANAFRKFDACVNKSRNARGQLAHASVSVLCGRRVVQKHSGLIERVERTLDAD